MSLRDSRQWGGDTNIINSESNRYSLFENVLKFNVI